MKFIHLSDIHLGEPGVLVEGLDPYARLERALDHMKRHHPDARRLIITGDLTHWADPGAYAALKGLLQGLPFDVRLLVGNHDERTAFFAAFPRHPRDEYDFVNHAEDLPEGRFIYCDTIEPQTHVGHFCERRLKWLKTQLDGCERAYVFMHHNPLHLGDPSTDTLSLNDADQEPLRGLLKTNRNKIAHIFFGHVHEPLSGTMAGIPFSGVSSTMHQCIPNLSASDTSASGPLDPSYRVVLLRGEDLVIHQIPFAWDGEVVQHGNNWEDWAKPACEPA